MGQSHPIFRRLVMSIGQVSRALEQGPRRLTGCSYPLLVRPEVCMVAHGSWGYSRDSNGLNRAQLVDQDTKDNKEIILVDGERLQVCVGQHSRVSGWSWRAKCNMEHLESSHALRSV